MDALLIGDVGGQAQPFSELLIGLGADPSTGKIPADLTIVQVGDLVDRGPDSVGVVTIVDTFLRGPDAARWVQLLGNHEEPYIFNGNTAIGWNLDRTSGEMIRAWWDDGLAHIAAAIRPDWASFDLPPGWRRPVGDLLVTHAGLTRGMWRILGEPNTAAEAAPVINADSRKESMGSPVWREGMMTTGLTDPAAGPLWAEAASELCQSWLGSPQSHEFHQVHGHSSVWDWRRETYNPAAGSIYVRGDLSTDREASVELVRLDEQLVWGVDPGHGYEPNQSWGALRIPLMTG